MSRPITKHAPFDRPRFSRNGHASTAKDHELDSPSTTASSVSTDFAAKPTLPLDDATIFAQLIDLAEKAGRLDLVGEFRRRATSPCGPTIRKTI